MYFPRSRRITLSTHGVLDVLVGMALMFLPFVLGFEAAGLIVSALLGAILTGMALRLNATPERLMVDWHHYFDSAFIVVAGLAAVILALSGDPVAALFIALVAVFQAGVSQSTLYTVTG